MRISESRQSNTSPLKYHIVLTPEEMERFKDKKKRVPIIKEMIDQASRIETQRKEKLNE